MVCLVYNLFLIYLIIVSVIQWAKKTGDYAVLSHPDLCVLALTYMLHEQGRKAKEMAVEKKEPDQASGLAIHCQTWKLTMHDSRVLKVRRTMEQYLLQKSC